MKLTTAGDEVDSLMVEAELGGFGAEEDPGNPRSRWVT
jgi:hypothetical protein